MLCCCSYATKYYTGSTMEEPRKRCRNAPGAVISWTGYITGRLPPWNFALWLPQLYTGRHLRYTPRSRLCGLQTSQPRARGKQLLALSCPGVELSAKQAAKLRLSANAPLFRRRAVAAASRSSCVNSPSRQAMAASASASAPQRALSASQQLRSMFYAMSPNESSFRSVDEVPDYVDKATPFFVALILLEFVVNWAQKGRSSARVSDGITCLSAGVLSRLPDALSRSVELTTYIYVWENNRLLELPWDSPWTWYLAFLGVDFGYYWFHRMGHEINLLWAAHQTHHSSEDYNLFTALRQSLLQKYTSWVFYLPMALFIPPSVYAVHLQFNLLYQFWIHTEIIHNLGPLEFVLNTPSHHRVHHGRNPYCIDKNYGGTLIIWDRIFGTFAAENEKVVYGLTHPINTFELFKVQFHHYIYIWNTFWNTPGFCNKISVIFKGPGWEPGKPRLGVPEDIPNITGKEVPYSPKLPIWLRLYAVIHFILMLGCYVDLFATKSTLSQVTLLLRVGYIILTLTSIGFLMEQRPEAAFLESSRCTTFLALHKLGYLKTYISLLSVTYEVLFSLSIAFWGVLMMKQLTSSRAKHH